MLRRPLALSRGDPSGIGLEVALKAWLKTHASREAETFFMVADLPFCKTAADALGLSVPFEVCSPGEAATIFTRAFPIVALPGLTSMTRGVPGQPHEVDAPGTIASMIHCVELVATGEAAAVVTNPISKEILHRVGFAHPGQTEFMGELARRLFGVESRAVMLLWSSTLAVVPATIHVPIASVPALVTRDLILDTIRIVARDFQSRFGLERPRIAITGLNPHAGEGGDIGREEIETIAPAIRQLVEEGYAVTGPHPGDTLFHAAARARYDVAITMFHDQALIPIKTLAFDSAVNVTLGLPFVRTSPDHGTAFDIAGKGIADPASLIAALQLAGRLARADRAAHRPDASG